VSGHHGGAARPVFERTLGPDHQRTLTVFFNLAAMRSRQVDRAAAVDAHRELLGRRRRLFGATHPSVAQSMVMIANELRASSGYDAGIALLDSAPAMQRAVYGDHHGVCIAWRGKSHDGRGARAIGGVYIDWRGKSP
jgi:hypothetical protein